MTQEEQAVGLIELITLVLMLALVGFLCWLVVTYIPMPEPFPKVIVVIIVIVVILYALRLLVGDIPLYRR